MSKLFYQQDTSCPRLIVQDDILLRGVSLNDRLGSLPASFTTSTLTTLSVSGASTLNTLSLTSTADLTALNVAGGVTIAKNVSIQGNLTAKAISTPLNMGDEQLIGGLRVLSLASANFIQSHNTRGANGNFSPLLITGLGGVGEKLRIDTDFVSVPMTSPSTSATTGALRVTGGLGVGGNICTGGKVILPGADDALITRGFDNFTSGKLSGMGRFGMFMEPGTLVIGIPNIPNRVFTIAGYNADSTFAPWFQCFGDTGVTRILSTTAATSTATGALTVAGGVGIAKELYVGGNVVLNSNIGVGTVPSYRLHLRAPTADNTSLIRLAAPNLGSIDPISSRIIYGNDGFGPNDVSASIDFIRTAAGYNGQVAMCFKTSMGGTANTEHCVERLRINPNGLVNITCTDNTSSATTGALTVAGGVGVAKSLFVGGTITASGLVSSGSTTLTGNLTVSGSINGTVQTSGTAAAIATQPGVTFLNEVENNLYWYRVGNIVHCVLMHRCQSPSGTSTGNFSFRLPFAPYYPIPMTGTGNYASTRVVLQGSSTTAYLMQTDASGVMVRYMPDSNNQAYFTYFCL